MELERFYETLPVDEIPSAPGSSAVSVTVYFSNRFFLVRFFVEAFVDFLLGMREVVKKL